MVLQAVRVEGIGPTRGSAGRQLTADVTLIFADQKERQELRWGSVWFTWDYDDGFRVRRPGEN